LATVGLPADRGAPGGTDLLPPVYQTRIRVSTVGRHLRFDGARPPGGFPL